MYSILKVLLLSSFCILVVYGLSVYFRGNSEEVKSLDSLVKSPIFQVNGETCPVFEEEIFTFEGKNSFSECEVRKNPNLFNGKLLRIKSYYGFMIHGSYLSDKEGCELSKSIDELISVGFQSEKDYDYIHSLKEFPVSIVAVGKFTVSVPTHNSDTIYDRTPYYFEVVCLEKAKS